MPAKRPKKGKLSKRIPAALTRWLKRQNPGKMKGVTKVRVKKLKGGGVTISPVRFNPSEDIDYARSLVRSAQHDLSSSRKELASARRRRDSYLESYAYASVKRDMDLLKQARAILKKAR